VIKNGIALDQPVFLFDAGLSRAKVIGLLVIGKDCAKFNRKKIPVSICNSIAQPSSLHRQKKRCSSS
jgi:hypothetical protein